MNEGNPFPDSEARAAVIEYTLRCLAAGSGGTTTVQAVLDEMTLSMEELERYLLVHPRLKDAIEPVELSAAGHIAGDTVITPRS